MCDFSILGVAWICIYVHQGVSDVICCMYAHVYEFVYVYEGVSVEWCYLFHVCICTWICMCISRCEWCHLFYVCTCIRICICIWRCECRVMLFVLCMYMSTSIAPIPAPHLGEGISRGTPLPIFQFVYVYEYEYAYLYSVYWTNNITPYTCILRCECDYLFYVFIRICVYIIIWIFMYINILCVYMDVWKRGRGSDKRLNLYIVFYIQHSIDTFLK